MKIINKFYYYCQIKGKTIRYLKIILKKDVDFNFKINVNITYLNKQPIFYKINTDISF